MRAGLAALGLVVVGCGSLLTMPDGASESTRVASPSPISEQADAGGPLVTAPDGGASLDGRAADVASPYAPYVFVPSTDAPAFVDDFARADGPLGGSWTDKTSGSFLIEAGTVVQKLGYPSQPLDLFASRDAPADVEVSASVVLDDDVGGWRLLYARVQSGSAQLGRMNGYVLSVNATSLKVGVYIADGSSIVGPGGAPANVEPTLVASRTYRVYLRVRGTDPVELEGGLFEDVTCLASVHVLDTSPYRIPTAGRAGFGGGRVGTRWDDYHVVGLE